ncbi:MAG: hypothetical protein KA144_06655 [Xanthomonadaceae bacterium]|nr:hypothetical protein [Xanthomonadaceae bacterium]
MSKTLHTMFRGRAAALSLALLALLCAAASLSAQNRPTPLRPVATEVPFAVVSAGQSRFAQPLQLGGPRGTRAEQRLDQAYLIRVEVPVAAYDALPPSIEPFLYIGRRELRTYSVERTENGKTLFVTYYLPGAVDAAGFEVGAPMVITTEHGRPLREPSLYRSRSDLQMFRAQWAKTR